MQVLFIAPVHGKKKPQLSYPYEATDNDNSINNRETLKQNSEFLNRALDVTRGRLENIVRRPKRSGSKVRLFLKVARLYYALSIVIFMFLDFIAFRDQSHVLVQKREFWCSDGALLLLRWLKNTTIIWDLAACWYIIFHIRFDNLFSWNKIKWLNSKGSLYFMALTLTRNSKMAQSLNVAE